MRAEWNVHEYRRILRISDSVRLLVEGKDDRTAFKNILDVAAEVHGNVPEVVIDLVEGIGSDGSDKELSGLGNREKIERICRELKKSELLENRFAALVDREYREFSITEIVDQLGNHRVEGVVFWTRGHSIENYWLDFAIFERVVKRAKPTAHFETALEHFHGVFESAIRIACAAGLAAFETQKTTMYSGLMSWNSLKYENGVLDMNWPRFEMELAKKTSSQELRQTLKASLMHWIETTSTADIDTARWLTHGHIGMKAMWSAYASVLFGVTSNRQEAEEANSIENGMRQNLFSREWAEWSVRNGENLPVELLVRLGIQVPSTTSS